MPAPSPSRRSVDHGAETLALGPAQVHAQQHFGPVLRFRAARAGMNGDDGVEASFSPESSVAVSSSRDVVSAAVISRSVSLQERFALRGIGLFLGHMEISVDVARHAGELVVRG